MCKLEGCRTKMLPRAIVTTMPMLAAFYIFPAGWIYAASGIALIAIGSRLLWQGRRALAGTTLIAAWWWAVLSWCALSSVAIALYWQPQGQNTDDRGLSLCFAAAMTTVCPGMAVLGAKRPQHVAWQWIVLSLWVVLVLPAAQWELFGSEPTLHLARKCFLGALVAIGVVNYLPTRYAAPAALFGIGQFFLLAPFFAGEFRADEFQLGLIQVLCAMDLALGLATRRRVFSMVPVVSYYLPRKEKDNELAPHDRLWRDFRDAYGLLWGLRVAERFNAQAAASGWPVTLTWRGFRSPTGDRPATLSPAERQAVTENLTSWLRRFVDAEWIARRLVADSAGPGAPSA
jgi:hypothetical protein